MLLFLIFNILTFFNHAHSMKSKIIIGVINEGNYVDINRVALKASRKRRSDHIYYPKAIEIRQTYLWCVVYIISHK